MRIALIILAGWLALGCVTLAVFAVFMRVFGRVRTPEDDEAEARAIEQYQRKRAAGQLTWRDRIFMDDLPPPTVTVATLPEAFEAVQQMHEMVRSRTRIIAWMTLVEVAEVCVIVVLLVW